ncbi:MAG: hypothetical protein ACRD29_07595, partial [Acidimicrobiales bacterium]
MTAEVRSCDGCGRARPIVSTRGGESVCGSCYNRSDLRPRRRCGRCGKVERICVQATAIDGDICVNCYTLPVAVCEQCGRSRPCQWVGAGTPTCVRCVPRAAARCAHCGENRPPAVRWAEGPVCDPCYGA